MIVFDFETGGRNPLRCQPTQIAAIALHSRKLTIEPNGTFNSEILPILDDEAALAAGVDPIEQGALDVTGKTRERLAEAPPLKLVWEDFVAWVNKFNYKKSNYTAPIPCGHNIINFDMPIINRLCNQFGQVDKEGRQNLFNNLWFIDTMQDMFGWTESNIDVKNRTLSATMDFMGMPTKLKDGAHDALQDVKNTTNILIKLLKFKRDIASKTNFKTSFANGQMYV